MKLYKRVLGSTISMSLKFGGNPGILRLINEQKHIIYTVIRAWKVQ